MYLSQWPLVIISGLFLIISISINITRRYIEGEISLEQTEHEHSTVTISQDSEEEIKTAYIQENEDGIFLYIDSEDISVQLAKSHQQLSHSKLELLYDLGFENIENSTTVPIQISSQKQENGIEIQEQQNQSRWITALE